MASTFTPFFRHFSSTWKRGLWLGAALDASFSPAVQPMKQKKPGASFWKKEKSSAPQTLSITCTFCSPATRCRLGTDHSVRPGWFTVTSYQRWMCTLALAPPDSAIISEMRVTCS